MYRHLEQWTGEDHRREERLRRRTATALRRSRKCPSGSLHITFLLSNIQPAASADTEAVNGQAQREWAAVLPTRTLYLSRAWSSAQQRSLFTASRDSHHKTGSTPCPAQVL